MAADLKQLLELEWLSPDEITARTREIHGAVLRQSPYLDGANFTAFHPADLERLFDEYDRAFFDGACRRALGGRLLQFRISRRMTNAGGKTTWLIRRNGSAEQLFEIAVSATLLFQAFHDVDRPITVTGLVCRDRLEALQRVIEHELVHLIELLVWRDSSCRAGRFQSIATGFFGHTEHTHRLITPRERAFVKFGIRAGSRVRFLLDGVEYAGVVNRVTKRATVLVPDERGRRYSDGRRYATFYIPLSMLEPLDGRCPE